MTYGLREEILAVHAGVDVVSSYVTIGASAQEACAVSRESQGVNVSCVRNGAYGFDDVVRGSRAGR